MVIIRLIPQLNPQIVDSGSWRLPLKEDDYAILMAYIIEIVATLVLHHAMHAKFELYMPSDSCPSSL